MFRLRLCEMGSGCYPHYTTEARRGQDAYIEFFMFLSNSDGRRAQYNKKTTCQNMSSFLLKMVNKNNTVLLWNKKGKSSREDEDIHLLYVDLLCSETRINVEIYRGDGYGYYKSFWG